MADELNFQIPKEGFDSYLYGIIPDDQAVLAGAFSVSMQQVRNIEKVDPVNFAQVAYNMENTASLPFIGGTDVPADVNLASIAKCQMSLGGGVYGTFTHSNFFGCMTGLPYPWKPIYDGIKQLETQTLYSIYQNLYLAVTWEQATATFNGSIFDGLPSGGGYTTSPNVTVDGNPATAVIGTNPDDISTFGRVVSISYSGPAGTVYIDPPPGGGWPAMNSVVQGYVNDANNEIQSIKQKNFEAARILEINWNITGTSLKQEQRARHNYIPPVPIPYDKWLNISPSSELTFVDSIPELSQDTKPHMSSQTLEHISALKTIPGQSVVGLSRESRNLERLTEVGIELDNTIPDTLDPQIEKMLLTNGTVPAQFCEGSSEGVPSDSGVDYTIPAFPAVEVADGGTPCQPATITTQTIIPKPIAFFDPNTQNLKQITNTKEGNISAIINNSSLGPFGNGSGPVILINGELPPGAKPPVMLCGDNPPEELVYAPTVDNNNQIPVVIVNPLVPSGPTPGVIPGAAQIIVGADGIPNREVGTLNNTPNLGVVSGIPGVNLIQPNQIIPPSLNSSYISSTLIPNTYDVEEAIDKVIECNCDCWVE